MAKFKKHLSYLYEPVTSSRRIIKSMKSKAAAKRSFSEKCADFMTAAFGSNTFLILNALWFAIWIAINLDFVPNISAFDPFPFGLLTMIVSLEAIILSIFVLIAQKRAARVDDLREEIDLQIDIITEQELTKLMQMVGLLLEKNGINTSKDAEIIQMLKPTSMRRIENALERQV
ncbi:DUF1003 domain-containing protein [Candidatus Peregrinibacteria bacterium]|nr:DUF1003 domain-containing protein [Candidatus Peregrinibacteria bacterium]